MLANWSAAIPARNARAKLVNQITGEMSIRLVVRAIALMRARMPALRTAARSTLEL